MKVYEFDAVIHKHEDINAAYIEFPYNVKEEFGTEAQIKVRARFDGYEYQGSLAKMGLGCHSLGMTQKVREAIGKQPGDTVHVVLQQDFEERTVEVPAELAAMLAANAGAREFFEGLSYTNRKEYAGWIASAKKQETREKRLEQAIRLLTEGIKSPNKK